MSEHGGFSEGFSARILTAYLDSRERPSELRPNVRAVARGAGNAWPGEAAGRRVETEKRIQMRRALLHALASPDGAGIPEVVRTCLACSRDFVLFLDRSPDSVFFCRDCSRPPEPGDELGEGD